MSDAVSKLYAEIGFKVNKQQLDNAKKVLEDFASRLSSINASASKIVSDISKSELKNTEETQKNIVYIDKRAYAQRINNLKIYARQATNIWRDLKKIALFPLNTAAKTIRTAQTLYKYMEPSLQKSYDFRKFAFESGMSLSDFQRQERAFNTLGIKMSIQDLMGDLLNVQRNLTKVALNQGGVLDAYKLTDVREGAQRGDLNAVITGIQRAVAENRIDESMLVQLMGMFGFGNPQEWAMRFRMNPADDARTKSTQITEEQNKAIQDANSALIKLSTAFNIFRDNIVATVSPAVITVFNYFREKLQSAAIYIKEHAEEISSRLEKSAKNVIEFIEGINWKELGSELVKYSKTLIDTFRDIGIGFSEFKEKYKEVFDAISKLGDIITAIFKGIYKFARGAGEFGAYWFHSVTGDEENAKNYATPTSKKVKEAAKKMAENYANLKGSYSSPSKVASVIYNYTDNSQQNNTFEGLDSEEQADKLKDILDEYYNKKETNLGIANDLSIVMSGSAGSSSDGSW